MLTGIAKKTDQTESGNLIEGKRYFFEKVPKLFYNSGSTWNTLDEYKQSMAFCDEEHLNFYFKEVE